MRMHSKRIGSGIALVAVFAAISACGGGGSSGSGGGSSGSPSGGGGSNEAVLYSFGATGGSDGSYPYAGLNMDNAGNFYGTTLDGGTNGTGTVFKITPAGSESIIYNFGPSSSSDGQNPQDGLITDSAGNFYGTTFGGGANNNGTVFKITPSGTESVLYSFGPSSGTDGRLPAGRLIMDGTGNLWGTTTLGGLNNQGTVFKITSSGAEAFLYSFTGVSGWSPYDGLIADKAGNFYGTTYMGGVHGTGVVFKITSTGTESVLYSFGNGGPGDGQNPQGHLVMDGAGNLYGTTTGGGANGLGTVFKVTSTGTESVLYSFSTIPDGDGPRDGLIIDSAGNLYGTTYGGGTYGQGTVFEISSTGSESVLYSFGTSSGTDGAAPYYGGLLMDSSGNLYGTTAAGGANGTGTVFKVN